MVNQKDCYYLKTAIRALVLGSALLWLNGCTVFMPSGDYALPRQDKRLVLFYSAGSHGDERLEDPVRIEQAVANGSQWLQGTYPGTDWETAPLVYLWLRIYSDYGKAMTAVLHPGELRAIDSPPDISLPAVFINDTANDFLVYQSAQAQGLQFNGSSIDTSSLVSPFDPGSPLDGYKESLAAWHNGEYRVLYLDGQDAHLGLFNDTPAPTGSIAQPQAITTADDAFSGLTTQNFPDSGFWLGGPKIAGFGFNQDQAYSWFLERRELPNLDRREQVLLIMDDAGQQSTIPNVYRLGGRAGPYVVVQRQSRGLRHEFLFYDKSGVERKKLSVLGDDTCYLGEFTYKGIGYYLFLSLMAVNTRDGHWLQAAVYGLPASEL